MTDRRAYILVPGIRSRTDDHLLWAVVMADKIMQRHMETAPVASEFRYFAGALFRRLNQQTHARELAGLIEGYFDAGFSVILVCHSNGADLFARAQRLAAAHIEAVHLIAAACEADVQKLGMAQAVEAGRIGCVYTYSSKSDSALGVWARLSGHLALLGLGYGSLGLNGPQNVPPDLQHKFPTIARDYLEHSDWFDPQHFEHTFLSITREERT